MIFIYRDAAPSIRPFNLHEKGEEMNAFDVMAKDECGQPNLIQLHR